MENCWIYQDKCLYTPPEGYYGFIYSILLPDGRIYWGKKAFEHSKKVKLSKKARKSSGTRKRIAKTKVDSGWLDYWGSSKELLDHLEVNPNLKNTAFREIIKLCKDKASLSYWEMVTLVENNILFRDDCYNGNISGKYFKGKIHK